MWWYQLLLLSLVCVNLTNGDLPMPDNDFIKGTDINKTKAAIARTDVEYRLPMTINPIEYDIDIDLNFEESDNRTEFSYVGRVTIVIQATEANVTQIVLHANVDKINNVDIMSDDNVPVLVNPNNPIVQEAYNHFLRINLLQELTVGVNYTLSIGYESTMNKGPLKRGIWRGHYIDASGVQRFYATTHFQPYNARQAFPCWDEPFFKSVFTLHITRPESYKNNYHNTILARNETLANGRIRDTYTETPIMSAYLLTFLVSETFEVIAVNNTMIPPVRIIGRSTAHGLGDTVLDMAVKLTEYFGTYLDVPYESMHPNLNNDHIASPDWASAGTENWGMVSYREIYMLIDPEETSMSVTHYSATLVTHELAHKWFGNLITCYWWNNTWINEGFASYFGYLATAEVFPEYEHENHFNTRYLQTSLETDSGSNPSALNHEVNAPAEVTSHFGTVSYSKGAAFLRMIKDIISEDTFRKACSIFLKTYSYQPTSEHDLYNSFVEAIEEDVSLSDHPDFDFENFYYSWVNKVGYPLLEVDINHETGVMNLSQRRFYLSTITETDDVYPIPITYSTSSNPNFNEVTPIEIMSTRTTTLSKNPQEEWVIFNNLQHGHYRVNYDDKTWELITNALQRNRESINFKNRAAIVDDVFPMMRSGTISYQFGFQILQFLINETNFHVWEPAMTGFNWIRNRIYHVTDARSEFEQFMMDTIENAISTVGYDVIDGESATTILARHNYLTYACNMDHPQCVTNAMLKFATMKSGGHVSPHIRRSVYMTGIRYGDDEDFEFLYQRLLSSNIPGDRLEMLRGLAATNSESNLIRYLQLTMTDEVRQMDRANAFVYALSSNRANAHIVLQFLMDNIEQIRVEFAYDAPNKPVHSVMSSVASYLSEEQLVEYETWLKETQSEAIEYSTAMSGISSRRTVLEWGTTRAEEMLSAIRGGAAGIVSSITMLVTMSLIVFNS